MVTVNAETVQTVSIRQEILIAASPEIAFEAVIDEAGPGSQMPDGTPFPMKIERWPGGRWFRDLGNNAGHLWGHVQVIKPPKLLEICGPMFMSYPAISHVQYRLTPEGGGTRLQLTHRTIGLLEDEHLKGMEEGWSHGMSRIRQIAEANANRKAGAR